MRFSLRSLVYAVGFLALAGCTSQTNYELQTEVDAAVINGLKVRETNKLAKSIVKVNGVMSCTGTLIASDLVLTAAHCVYGGSTAEVSFERSSGEGDSYTGEVVVHESFGGPEEPIKQGDLALIKMTQNAPKGYQPIPLLKDSSKVTDSTVLHIYGYGASEVRAVDIDAGQYPISYLDQLIQMGLVKCNEDRTSCVRYTFNQNEELHRGVTRKVESVEKVFITSYEAFKFDTCFGDSGGPVFAKIEGQYYLYGVTSAGSGDVPCQSYAINVDVTKYIDWISNSIEKLKKAPESQRPLKED